jgi:hypothetical protein
VTAATAAGTTGPQANLINQLLTLIQGEAKYATLPSTIYEAQSNTYGANPGITSALGGANAAATGVSGAGTNIFNPVSTTSTSTSAPNGPSTQPKT